MDKRIQTVKDANSFKNYLVAEQICAYILFPNPHIGTYWKVKVEKTTGTKFGAILYTEKGKAIGSGTGELLPNGRKMLKIKTLYGNITNAATIHASLTIETTTDSGGHSTTTVSGSCTCTWES